MSTSIEEPRCAIRGGGGTARDSPPSLTLLGGFAFEDRGKAVPLQLSAQRLVAYLGIRGAATRPAIGAALWPDVDLEHGQARLRTAMWRLHRSAPRLVSVAGDRVALAGHVVVDIHDLERCAAGPGGTATYSGDLLPGWYDDWVLCERERLRQVSLHGLETRVARHLAQRRWAAAVDVALEVVRLEPLRESAHRMVIAAHLGEDNLGEALRQYSLLFRLLDTELGVRPSAPTRALLHDRIPPGWASKLLR